VVPSHFPTPIQIIDRLEPFAAHAQYDACKIAEPKQHVASKDVGQQSTMRRTNCPQDGESMPKATDYSHLSWILVAAKLRNVAIGTWNLSKSTSSETNPLGNCGESK